MLQPTVNKTSSRIADQINNVLTSSGQQQQQQQQLARLPTVRSLPDLSAAHDNPSAGVPDHTHRHQNNNVTAGQTNNGVHVLSDYRERVLYELTNQLRPSTIVVRPSLNVTSSTHQRTVNDTRGHSTKSADESTGPRQKRPAPPPRGMSTVSTASSHPLHASSPAISLLTTSTTGSELKQLLADSGMHAPPTTSDYEQQSFTTGSTSSTFASRSVISGEHLVLPSQLKKPQRSPTDIDSGTSKQDKVGDIADTSQPLASQGAVKLNNGYSSSATAETCQSVVITEYRSPPVPKRPAPPPPPLSKLTTALPATCNGGEEVNFLVMAEKARRQYVLSKLARDTLASGKPSAQPAYGHQTTRATDALQTAVNGMATTNGASHFTANVKNLEHEWRTSSDLRIPTTASAHVDVHVSSDAGRTVQQTTDNSSLSAESLPLRSDQLPSEMSPPVVRPKRPPRNSRQVELRSDQIPNDERRPASNVAENGGPETHLSSAVGDKAVNMRQDTPKQHDSNAHGRKSNAKLIRNKNVLIRRSGASRLLADDSLAISSKHPSTNGLHRAREDAEEKIQQLASTSDTDVLPPPPDFAD